MEVKDRRNKVDDTHHHHCIELGVPGPGVAGWGREHSLLGAHRGRPAIRRGGRGGTRWDAAVTGYARDAAAVRLLPVRKLAIFLS